MPNGNLDRREFIRTASSAAGLGLIGSLVPGARVAGLVSELHRSASMPSESFQTRELEAVAQQAVDDALAHGAQFADVRVNVQRFLRIDVLDNGARARPTSADSATLGLRSVVDGAWGDAGAYNLTSKGVRDVARLAVERARAGRGRHADEPFEFAPAPAVPNGEWETPIERDPFAVPIPEHEALILEAMPDVARPDSAGAAIRSSVTTMWVKSQRAFASSEGSLISQRTFTAWPGVGVWAVPAGDQTRRLSFTVPTVRSGSYGYEAIAGANLKQEYLRAWEEALRVASLPVRSVDVGRYDLVLSPSVAADVLVHTIGHALELDRALGEKAADAGTTYAMPPDAVLGAYQLGSELLTVTGDRSRPGGCATVGWDEEGVRPEDFVLVQDGTIVDYVTTRRTAPALASWYQRRGEAVRSHGCAAGTGNTGWPSQPLLRLPNLTIRPGSASADVDDLIRDVKRGFYVVDHGGASVDQQCLNTQMKASLAYEIRDGKLGGLVGDMAFQFSTPRFWQSLDALGGVESASLESLRLPGFYFIGVQSVPALFRQVNVVNTGKQA